MQPGDGWVKEVETVELTTFFIGRKRCCLLTCWHNHWPCRQFSCLENQSECMLWLIRSLRLWRPLTMYIKRFKKPTRRFSYLANIATGAWGRSLCCRNQCLGGSFVDLWVGRSYLVDVSRSDEFIVLEDHNNRNRNKTDEKRVIVKNVRRFRRRRGRGGLCNQVKGMMKKGYVDEE